MKVIKTRGFTVIEMVVVIGIIGLLAAVVYIAAGEARAKGRDTQRISDLNQIVIAMRLHAEQNNTFKVAGTGSNNGGQGWFAYEGTNYTKSIAEGLVEAKLLPDLLHDPLVPSGLHGVVGHYQYMHYFVNGDEYAGSCVFAQLENPSPAHEDAFDDAPVPATTKNSLSSNYDMNYAVCT